MSTHASIAFRDVNGKITSIYCHYDGYIDGVGVTLKNCWNDVEKVKQLFFANEEYPIRSLGFSIKETEYLYDNPGYSTFGSVREWIVNDQQEYMYLFDEKSKRWLWSPGWSTCMTCMTPLDIVFVNDLDSEVKE